jgi:hypothetical protein
MSSYMGQANAGGGGCHMVGGGILQQTVTEPLRIRTDF